MALLNPLVAGESSGMPTGMGNVNGLLANPYLQLGLGILGANNSRNFGQVVGQGAQQGLANLQRQQLFQQQARQQEMQNKEFERRQAEFEREQKALQDFKTKFPELSGVVDLDPKAAIKSAYPNLASNQADPYFTPIPTEQGLGKFNARTGQFELLTDPTGKPIIKTSDSPTVRGAVSQAEAGGKAAYNVDTSIPGVVSTAKQVAEMANPSLLGGNLPTQATPTNMKISPQVQAGRDDLRLKILLDEQAQGGGVGANPELDREIARVQGVRIPQGIPVPTKAQETADTERAKNVVATEAEKVKNVKKADQFLSVANQAKTILNSKTNKPTASGVGALVDAAGNIVGVAPKGSESAAELEALSGWLVSNVPRMEGPQSNFDVQNYQTMAGMVGDRTKPLAVRQKALDTVINLQEKYKALNQDGNIMPKGEQMPKALAMPAKPSKLTLKKGSVYQTPMGNLRWNGTAFED